MKVTKELLEARRQASYDESKDEPVVGGIRTTLLGYYVGGEKITTTKDIQEHITNK